MEFSKGHLSWSFPSHYVYMVIFSRSQSIGQHFFYNGATHAALFDISPMYHFVPTTHFAYRRYCTCHTVPVVTLPNQPK